MFIINTNQIFLFYNINTSRIVIIKYIVRSSSFYKIMSWLHDTRYMFCSRHLNFYLNRSRHMRHFIIHCWIFYVEKHQFQKASISFACLDMHVPVILLFIIVLFILTLFQIDLRPQCKIIWNLLQHAIIWNNTRNQVLGPFRNIFKRL